MGTISLLYFHRPSQHARHYTGYTTNLPARLADHDSGLGAHLLAVVKAHGIGWIVARTWSGSRNRERQLKRQGGASRRCPLCATTLRKGPHREPI